MVVVVEDGPTGGSAPPVGPARQKEILMLTSDEAADIARKHGLGIDAAVSLRALADTTAEAETIAKKFTATDEQRFAAQLFDSGEPRGRAELSDKSTPEQVARDLFAK